MPMCVRVLLQVCVQACSQVGGAVQGPTVGHSPQCLPEYHPLCVCGLAWPQGCSLSRVLQPEALHLEKGDLLKSVHLYARSLREHRMRSDQGGHVLVVLPRGLQNKEMDKLAWPVPGLPAPLWTQLQGKNQLAGERRVKIGRWDRAIEAWSGRETGDVQR